MSTSPWHHINLNRETRYLPMASEDDFFDAIFRDDVKKSIFVYFEVASDASRHHRMASDTSRSFTKLTATYRSQSCIMNQVEDLVGSALDMWMCFDIMMRMYVEICDKAQFCYEEDIYLQLIAGADSARIRTYPPHNENLSNNGHGKCWNSGIELCTIRYSVRVAMRRKWWISSGRKSHFITFN